MARLSLLAATAPHSLCRSDKHRYARADSGSVCLVAGTDMTCHEKTPSLPKNNEVLLGFLGRKWPDLHRY